MPEQQEKLFSRNFVLCFCAATLHLISANMVTPLIAQYVVELGGSMAIAGVIAGIFSLLAFVFRPFVGFAADRMRRRRMLMVGLTLNAICILGYGLSTSVAMVAAFRILHSLALTIQSTCIMVVATDFVPHSRMAEGVGYMSLAFTLGVSIGPMLGVWISGLTSLHAMFYVSAGIVFVGMLLLIPLPDRAPLRAWGEGTFSLKELFCAEIIPLVIYSTAFAFSCGIVTSFLVMLGDERGIVGVSAFFLISSVGMMLLRPPVGRYVDRKGISTICRISFVCECGVLITLVLAQSFAGIVIAALFRIFGQGIVAPTLQGHTLKCVSDDRRGIANSTMLLSIDIGQGFGAILGGALIGQFGMSSPYEFGVVLMIIGFIVYLGYERKQKRLSAQAD